MPSSLNKVILIGNLGKDAETRHTTQGTPVTTFSLATTSRIKDSASGGWQDKTEWHSIVLWRGDRVAPYLKKGKKVCVEGRLQTRSWEDRAGNRRYTTEVVCDAFGLYLLGGRGGSGGGFDRRDEPVREGSPSGPAPTPPPAPEASSKPRKASPPTVDIDDDIPF